MTEKKNYNAPKESTSIDFSYISRTGSDIVLLPRMRGALFSALETFPQMADTGG